MSESADQADEQKLRRAVALHQNGRLAEAAGLYEDILRTRPTHFDATFFLGISCAQRNLLESAAKHLARAAAINPAFVDAHFNCAVVLQSLGRLEEALDRYNRALSLKSDHVRALCNRGIILSSLRRFDEALLSFDAALRINPDYAEALGNRGIVLGELRRFEEALRECDRAIEIKPDYAEAHSNRGNALSALKRHEEALESYDRALRFKPDFADALSNRGVALGELKRFEQALQSHDRVIQLKPDVAAAHYNRAIALVALKRFEDAVRSYECAIRIDPNYAQAYCNRGNALSALERFEEAVESYDRAIQITPDFAEAFSNRGVALGKLRRYQEALRSCDRAIEITPDHATAHYNRSIAFGELERFEEALQSCDRAIQLQPDYAKAYHNRGAAAAKMKRFEEAVCSYDRAIQLNPNYADSYSNRGAALVELRRYEEALQSCERAIQLEPNYAEAYANQGVVLGALKRFEEAVRSYDRAILSKPEYVEAYSGRGTVLLELSRFDEALRSYDRAIQLAPHSEYSMGQFLLTKMRICDWSNFASIAAEISDRLSRDEKVVVPFSFLAQSSSPGLQKKAAEIWVRDKCPPRAVTEFPKRSPGQRIRVGYFSADFQNHAAMVLAAELFERHDRSKFDLLAVSFGSDTEDSMRRRVKAAFEKFIGIRDMSDQDVAGLARKLEIDIAVDLMGFTRDSRTNIFAQRAAPVQVNFLGYPGTTGADYIDYLIADETVIPATDDSHYREKIVYLPNTYLPNDRKREISNKTFTRSELGLPAEGFVFCCFNNNYKVTPYVFDSWMKILRHVEKSVLWLLADNTIAAQNLRKEADTRGVDPRRLVFASRMVLPDHLARHRTADLFLDTLPYNAHTTASDALWAGLPVLTQIGETFAGRVAASLLNAVHLPELVTTTRDSYEERAVELATDPVKLAAVKQKLSANRLTTPLFDSELFTKHIEAAYTAMYARYQAGLPADHIYVPQ